MLTENIFQNTKEIPFEIQKIDREDQTVSQFAFLQNNQVSEYQNKETLQKQKFELKSETKKILGYTCKRR